MAMGLLMLPILVGILACVIAFFGVIRRRNYSASGYTLPTGPFGNVTPIVGYLPYMTSLPHVHLCQLAKRYGDAFTVRFGSYDIVVLNNPSLIKSCFLKSAFTGRPNHLLAMEVSKHGITFATGEDGMEQRRFSLKTLRDLGFGKRYMESLIIEEVNQLVAHFRESPPDEVHSLKHLFGLSVINALWSILASRKFSITDPYACRVYQKCIQGFIDPPVAGALWFLPFLAKCFPVWSGYNCVVNATEELSMLIAKVIDERKQALAEGRNSETVDFVDAYLARIEEETDPFSSFYGETGYKNLVHVLLDLFTAGSDTLNSSLNFAIKYLCEDPILQKRVHKEIDTVLEGRSDGVTIDDRKNMPLLDAVITETLRMSSIVTGGILHSTTEDTSITANGIKYQLPKDTIIMANLYWVHHNPAYWHEPEVFNPKRFLVGGGDQKKQNVMAFSAGKRVCIAEKMAQDEFFLFLGGLLKNFEFEGVHGDKLGVFGEIKNGLVLNVDGLKVKIKDREK